jgi:hypothetical protein
MKTISQRSTSSSILLLFFLLYIGFLASSPLPVFSFTCTKYTSSVQLNEKAFPYNSDYTSKRTYFGAPASCDALLKDKLFFVPQNGTEKRDVEQQAFSSGFGLGALEDECRIPATRYLCAFAFRRCELQPFSPSLPNFLGKSLFLFFF